MRDMDLPEWDFRLVIHSRDTLPRRGEYLRCDRTEIISISHKRLCRVSDVYPVPSGVGLHMWLYRPF